MTCYELVLLMMSLMHRNKFWNPALHLCPQGMHVHVQLRGRPLPVYMSSKQGHAHNSIDLLLMVIGKRKWLGTACA